MRSWTVEHVIFEGMTSGPGKGETKYPDIEVELTPDRPRQILNIKIGASPTKLTPDEAKAFAKWLDQKFNPDRYPGAIEEQDR